MKTRLLWLVALVAALTMASCHRTSDNTENNTDTQAVEQQSTTPKVTACIIPVEYFDEGWVHGDWRYTADMFVLRRENINTGMAQESEWNAQSINKCWLIGDCLLVDPYCGTGLRTGCIRVNLNTFGIYENTDLAIRPEVENDQVLFDSCIMTLEQFATLSDAEFATLVGASTAAQ